MVGDNWLDVVVVVVVVVVVAVAVLFVAEAVLTIAAADAGFSLVVALSADLSQAVKAILEHSKVAKKPTFTKFLMKIFLNI